MLFRQFQKSVDRCDGTCGNDASADRRDRFGAPLDNLHPGFRLPGHLPQEDALSGIRFDQAHVGRTENGQDEARQAGARADIDNRRRRMRQVIHDLTAIQNMAAPGVRQGAGSNEIDCALPFLKQFDIAFEPTQCFT